jgi:hypothetical protein
MTRLGLAVLTVALLVVGLPLVVAPGRTDRYFAWTIDVPLTAGFLGACYWTAALFTFLSARERTWERVRVVMPGILVAGTLILAATLIHIDRFAMDSMRGWIWVILYAGLPPGVLLLLALEAGGRPPVGHGVAAVFGAALIAVAAALYAFPATTAGWWPWPLTPLTARMIGAWLAAVGATLIVRREDDRNATVYLAAFGAAQLLTLARAPGTVQWDEAGAWIYVAFLAALLAPAAAVAFAHGRRPEHRRVGRRP